MPGKVAVGEIGGLAGDMARHVGALQTLADLVEVVLALVGEIVLGRVPSGFPQAAFWELARAAASTAWMIGS